MIDLSVVKDHTLRIRGMVTKIAMEHKAQADRVPAGWNNNLRWHIGHLVVVPHALTQGLLGEPLSVPAEYRQWFGKDTSPANWGTDPVPPIDELIPQLSTRTEALFAAFADRAHQPYPKPYTTTPGAVLDTPAKALNFSLAHDGIHLGLVLALRRALAAK